MSFFMITGRTSDGKLICQTEEGQTFNTTEGLRTLVDVLNKDADEKRYRAQRIEYALDTMVEE